LKAEVSKDICGTINSEGGIILIGVARTIYGPA